MAFGVATLKEHFLMFGYSTHALDQTGKPLSNLLTDTMSRRRKGSTTKGSEVEHSMFTPLVLSTTGGMGRAATAFYKRLAAMLSEKRDVPYSKMIGWIRCRMSFSLVRASVLSIRGARSSATKGALHKLIEPQVAEGQLQFI